MKLKRRKTINDILKQKNSLVCLTAYTKPIAQIIDKFTDIILVGDSVGPVLYGYKSTRGVTLDMMIRHGKAVVESTKNSLIIIDLPFGSYEKKKELAYKNASMLIKETGATGIKLEGGEEIVPTVKYLVERGLNVMGHVGMKPQLAVSSSDYKVYGKKEIERKKIFKDVVALENSGAFSIVIEATIENISREITKLITIPTIGIGATIKCTGQILVTEDLIGHTNFKAKFLKKYGKLNKYIELAVKNYCDDVKKKKFPSVKHVYRK